VYHSLCPLYAGYWRGANDQVFTLSNGRSVTGPVDGQSWPLSTSGICSGPRLILILAMGAYVGA